ncbi:MAG TPA: hypothetical protein ENN99_03890 [Chloroflexi bacterium]|nr:hypothetical protein [Chloroflexota bacterium]
MACKDDVRWWVEEAQKHPESAAAIVEELAERLVELNAENEQLRDEIVRLRQPAPAAATAGQNGVGELDALRERVATLQALLSGKSSSEPSVVFVFGQLQAARIVLSQAQRMTREARPVLNRSAMARMRCLVVARPQDDLFLLTSYGRGFKHPLLHVPPLPVEEGTGEWAEAGEPTLSPDEGLTAAVAVAEPPRFWTVVTRRGYVRSLLRIEVEIKCDKGAQVIESPFRRDVPVAIVDGDADDLLVLTRWGQGIRFPQRTIEGPGSTALELEPDDEVVAALPLSSDSEVLIVTAAGLAARYNTAHIEAQTRPGGTGRALIRAFDVLAAFPYHAQAQLVYLTYSGKLIVAATENIPPYARLSKGTQVRSLDRDPAVAVGCVLGE